MTSWRPALSYFRLTLLTASAISRVIMKQSEINKQHKLITFIMFLCYTRTTEIQSKLMFIRKLQVLITTYIVKNLYFIQHNKLVTYVLFPC